MTSSELQPILPGFCPDPSICRVGEEYFIACSSFEYTPAVPIWHSRDLLQWELVGNALTTREQLDVSGTPASLGICAPTLRHHKGRFWLITTNNHRITDGHTIVHASDPAGPWSAPVFTGGTVGIDPDLAWDEEGQCYLTWTSFDPACLGIVQARVDPLTGELLESPRPLWSGSGLASPEGPHVYRRGEFWYLVVAEGGTQRGHAVSIARSHSIEGPFESCPTNPILTRAARTHEVQNTGHADFVETANGEWVMVYLGVRPRGGGYGFHTNGRETFIAGVEWVDGWPVISTDRYDIPPIQTAFKDHFDGPLHARWVSPRVPLDEFTRPEGSGQGIVVSAAPEGAALLARVRDDSWEVQVELQRGDGDVGRLLVRLDDNHWCAITAGDDIVAEQHIGPNAIVLARTPAPRDVVLWARSVPVPRSHPALQTDPDEILLGVTVDGHREELARARGRYLSTETAGGFTGRLAGIECTAGEILVRSIRYQAVDVGE